MAHSKMGPFASTSFLSCASESSPWVLRTFERKRQQSRFFFAEHGRDLPFGGAMDASVGTVALGEGQAKELRLGPTLAATLLRPGLPLLHRDFTFGDLIRNRL